MSTFRCGRTTSLSDMDQRSPLTLFLDQAATRYRDHESQIAQHLSRAIVRASKGSIREPQTERIPCPTIPNGLKSDADPLLTQAAKIADQLAWRASAGSRENPDLVSKIAVAEIVGPDGIIWSDQCRFGLLHQDLRVFYPRHQHEAEELYLVLCGDATWQKDGSLPEKQKPGTFIHHIQWQPHAIKTVADPLLALWGWTGNIAISSYAMVKQKLALGRASSSITK